MNVEVQVYVRVLMAPGPIPRLVRRGNPRKIPVLTMILFHPDAVGLVFTIVPVVVFVTLLIRFAMITL